MPGTRSSAATKCISEVPGLEKQVSTPLRSRVCTRLSAPFIAVPSGQACGAANLREGGAAGNSSPAFKAGETMAVTVLYSENIYPDDSVERRIYGPDVKVIFPQQT